MDDIKCPYCEQSQEINHDGGYGYEDDILHEQECGGCEKVFTYTTNIIYVYESYKADCLNGDKHKYEPTITYPKQFTKMRCTTCESKREPTKQEWEFIN